MSKNYFIAGISDLLVLSLLDGKDRYMYEIVKSISAYSGGKLNISQNTIYTVAYKLVADGKISEYNKLVGKKRTRVYYHLEPKGMEYLETLKSSFTNTIEGVNNIMSILYDESNN